MPSEQRFKWIQRRTRFFGDVWTPLVRTEIRSIGGQWLPFFFQLDSGAVVSLLEHSAGSLLGLQVEGGRHIELSNVGGAVTAAWIHELTMRVSDEIEIVVPVAFAESDTVPPLLGWEGVFSKLRICFDPVLRTCSLELP